MSAFIVISCSLVAMALLGLSNPVRAWWTSLWSHRTPAFVVLLALATTFVGGSGQATAEEGLGAASGLRLVRAIMLLLLLCIALLRILRDARTLSRAGPAALWMVAYAVLAIASLSYSISPFISAWKGFEVLVLALAIISLAGELRTHDDIQRILNILWLALLFLVLTAFFGAIVVPERAFAKLEQSSSIVISGVYPEINANSLTQFSALIAVVVLTHVLRPGKRTWALNHLVVIAISGTTMLMAHSRTSIFAGLVAILTVIYYSGRRALFFGSLITAVLAWSSAEFVADYILRGQSQQAFLGLSGRTHFWETYVWPLFSDSPYIGHGFYAAQRMLLGTSSVDNTYLEVALGLGILGLAIFIVPIGLAAYWLFLTRPVRNSQRINQGLWLNLVGLFILLVVRSLTGPSFQVMHPNLVMLLLLVVCLNAFVRLSNRIPSIRQSTGESSGRQSLPNVVDRTLPNPLARANSRDPYKHRRKG